METGRCRLDLECIGFVRRPVIGCKQLCVEPDAARYAGCGATLHESTTTPSARRGTDTERPGVGGPSGGVVSAREPARQRQPGPAGNGNESRNPVTVAAGVLLARSRRLGERASVRQSAHKLRCRRHFADSARRSPSLCLASFGISTENRIGTVNFPPSPSVALISPLNTASFTWAELVRSFRLSRAALASGDVRR